MGDPFFDEPRRPFVSDVAVRWLCGTAAFLGVVVFACVQPAAAQDLIGFVLLLGFLVVAASNS